MKSDFIWLERIGKPRALVNVKHIVRIAPVFLNSEDNHAENPAYWEVVFPSEQCIHISEKEAELLQKTLHAFGLH